MYQNWNMPATLNRAELALFNPLQYLDPTFYKVGDYLGCFWRGTCYGLLLNSPIIILGVTSPVLLANFFPFIVATSCLLGIVFSAVAHSFQVGFRERVALYGVSCFLDYQDVNYSRSQAFELCLASTMQLRSAIIVRSVEGVQICARVTAVPDRTVVITLEQMRTGTTRVAVDCVKHWSPLYARFIRNLFGWKFEQLMMRVDDGINASLIAEVSSFVKETPNWDYKHEGFSPAARLMAVR